MLGDTDFLYWRRRMNSGQTERITPKGLKLLAGGLSAANTTGYVLLKRIDPDRVSQQTALRRPGSEYAERSNRGYSLRSTHG